MPPNNVPDANVKVLVQAILATKWAQRAMTCFELNGNAVDVDTTPETPMLWVLRDPLILTGTKFGCGKTSCRACTAHVDGEATFSCLLPLSAVEGHKVTTTEGLGGCVAEAVLNAWDSFQVPQCGYCQPGQVMAAAALLTRNPRPTDATSSRRCSSNCAAAGRTGLMDRDADARSKVTLRNGRVEQTNFGTFAIPRLPEVPPIEVTLIGSDARPGAASERRACRWLLRRSPTRCSTSRASGSARFRSRTPASPSSFV